MRVTLLTQWFEPEPPRLQLPLALALSRRGFDIEVVTGFPNYPSGKIYPGYSVKMWQRETIAGIPIVRLPLYPSHDRNTLRRITNYASFAASAAVLGPLLARRSDAIYVYPPPTVFGAAAVFRKAWGAPILHHIADLWPESAIESGMMGSGPVKKALGSALEAYCQWVYSECDVITLASPGYARILAARGIDPGKMHLVYNWADDDLFRPVPRDARLADELGMAGRFNVVYAGNMGPFQGLDTVLRAAALLRDLADVQFVLVGTGTEATRLEDLAKKMGATNVRFLRQRPVAEMPALNALADALVVHLRDLPFFRSTTPGKTQVSLACGRPVIMAVAGDAADVVQRSGGGLTVAPEDPAALAGAVTRLRELPPEERDRMGMRGRAYYLREMSLDVGAGRIAELLHAMHAGHRRRSGT